MDAEEYFIKMDVIREYLMSKSSITPIETPLDNGMLYTYMTQLELDNNLYVWSSHMIINNGDEEVKYISSLEVGSNVYDFSPSKFHDPKNFQKFQEAFDIINSYKIANDLFEF